MWNSSMSFVLIIITSFVQIIITGNYYQLLSETQMKAESVVFT